ncbi:hypothetical protein [Streptomyces sp. NRRL S-337]|uniref:hypothetical protein n=1 Tax=Streptomyces sp. NRRL S-337 TaxID=1463900 RepID=UPI003B63F32F
MDGHDFRRKRPSQLLCRAGGEAVVTPRQQRIAKYWLGVLVIVFLITVGSVGGRHG